MLAALRCCMVVRMAVASRRSMWCWTATATDLCPHTRWLRHTLVVRWQVWGRWATPSPSLEENLPVPPSVGSTQTRPAAKVRSLICNTVGTFCWQDNPSLLGSAVCFNILVATHFVVVLVFNNCFLFWLYGLSVKLVQINTPYVLSSPPGSYHGCHYYSIQVGQMWDFSHNVLCRHETNQEETC